jgi:hypothetical protein
MLVLEVSFSGLHLGSPDIDVVGGATISTIMIPILEPCIHDAAEIANSRTPSTTRAGIQAAKKVYHISVPQTI